MMNITINIQAPELAHAIETLAIAIGCSVDKIGVGQAIQEAVMQHPANENSWVVEAEKALIVQAPEEVNFQVENEVDGPIFTLEEVRKALGDLAKAKGKEVAKAILAQFNVSKVTDLVPSQFNAAMQAIKEA